MGYPQRLLLGCFQPGAGLPRTDLSSILANRVEALLSRLPFGVSSPVLPAAPFGGRLSCRGSLPSSRYHHSASTSAGYPGSRSVPSSGFLNLSTVCSAPGLCGFITPRNHVQGSSPSRGFSRSAAGPDSSSGRAPVPLPPDRSPAETGCHDRTARLRGLAPRIEAFLGVGV